MVRLETEFLSIDIPELFERLLQVGPLTRAERMDRAAGEASFAELNLYVGSVDDDRLSLPELPSAEAIAEAVWLRHLDREHEGAEAPVGVAASRFEAGERFGVLELSATPWRPPTRQVVLFRGFAASSPPCMASFVLEYDASFDHPYRAAADVMLRSLRWKPEPFTESHIARQAKVSWSVFDGMAPERVEALRRRYLELLRPQRETPASKMAEPLLVDLVTLGPGGLSLKLVRELASAQTEILLRVPEFEAVIELELDGEPAGGEADALALLGHLARLNAEDRAVAERLVYEHAKLCFETTDYGLVPEGLSNADYFGVHGPTDAFAELGPGRVYLSDDASHGAADLFGVSFDPPWEQEHGCTLVLRDGRFVGWMEGGGFLQGFAR